MNGRQRKGKTAKTRVVISAKTPTKERDKKTGVGKNNSMHKGGVKEERGKRKRKEIRGGEKKK